MCIWIAQAIVFFSMLLWASKNDVVPVSNPSKCIAFRGFNTQLAVYLKSSSNIDFFDNCGVRDSL